MTTPASGISMTLDKNNMGISHIIIQNNKIKPRLAVYEDILSSLMIPQNG